METIHLWYRALAIFGAEPYRVDRSASADAHKRDVFGQIASSLNYCLWPSKRSNLRPNIIFS